MVSENDYILKFAGDKKSAQKLGAFYTPPSLGRRMVDKVSQSFVRKKCLDNCCGYGNLILQMLDAKVRQGEDPTQALTEVYGNEFDASNLEICIRNLKVWAKINHAKWINAVMEAHFHTGDALTSEAYEFEDPDVDFKSAVDENDIEEILEAERKAKPVIVSIKPEQKVSANRKTTQKKSISPKKTSELPVAKKTSEKKQTTSVETKKTAVFVLFNDRFEIECNGKRVVKKGVGQKFCRSIVSVLNSLKSKGVEVTADANTAEAWNQRLSLYDLTCECQLIENM